MEVLIPLVRQADYLGAVISYDCFSSQTLAKRLAQGRTAQVQLRKVLNARKGLLLSQRVLLWRTTVWPCLLYGLGACGLTASHLASLQTLALKQLRALSNSPAHIHHESDAALCLRLKVRLPQAELSGQFERMLRRQIHDDPFVLGPQHPWILYLQSCWADPREHFSSASSLSPAVADATVPSPPGLAPGPTSPVPSTTTLPLTSVPPLLPVEEALDVMVPCTPSVDAAPPSFPIAPPPDPPSDVLSFPCTLCERSFDTRKSLKLHMARTHKQRTVQIEFDRGKHALHGLPTCVFCRRDFTRWEGLSAHITNRRCASLPDSLVFASASATAEVTPADPLVEAAADAALAAPSLPDVASDPATGTTLEHPPDTVSGPVTSQQGGPGTTAGKRCFI